MKIIDHLKLQLFYFSKKGKWQNQIVKILTNDFFWLLLICYIIRLLFYSNYVNTDGWFPDTKAYINYHVNIFKGQVDYFHTPIFPFFIKFIRLFGEGHLFRNVKVAQCIISFFTIIVFYKIVNIVFKNKFVVFITTIIYSITPSISNFDVCLTTESLSINGIIIFLYLIISYLKTPKIYNAIILTLFIFLLIMLRPSFIYLLPLIILFWIFRIILFKKDWKLNLSGLATSFVCVFLIIGYSRLNYINNGCNFISVVSSYNQLNNIIDYKIYENGNDPEISETLKKLNTPKDVTIDREPLFAKYSYHRMAKFINNCILNQPKIYIRETLFKIFKLSQTNTISILALNKNGFWGIPNLITNIFSISFLNFYILMLFDFIYIIFRWIKSKQIPWFNIILWSIIVSQFATIIVGSYAEFDRLFVIDLPCIIILLFTYIDMFFYSIDKDKLSKYSTFAFNK